jgi:predicted ester cyclase
MIDRLDERYDFLEDNKAVGHYYVKEVQQGGRFDLIDEFVAEDFVSHTYVGTDKRTSGRSHIRPSLEALHTAFPDLEVDIQLELAGEDDTVTRLKIFRGTQDGEWLGFPPTGRKVEFPVLDVIKYRNRLVIGHWAVVGELQLLRQIGAIDAKGYWS